MLDLVVDVELSTAHSQTLACGASLLSDLEIVGWLTTVQTYITSVRDTSRNSVTDRILIGMLERNGACRTLPVHTCDARKWACRCAVPIISIQALGYPTVG